ncbi:MAG: hypothetical protein LQ340_005012 [Diploschistes diacapsis]|nr:MAG: hypothetical protein LQ340_005012 [Diploschistes diacapsis]
MSRVIFALALAVLCSEWKCLAFPTERRQITPSCTDFIVPVTASAPSKLLLPGDIPTDLSDPTVLVDFVTSQATSALGSLLGGLLGAEVSGTYDISARYCEPSNHNASRAQTVNFLVHAITDDKDYWNGLSYPEGYDGEQYSWLGYASQVRPSPPAPLSFIHPHLTHNSHPPFSASRPASRPSLSTASAPATPRTPTPSAPCNSPSRPP